ncbi:MAG: efflux RND transporter periplasmic adaptor subunit [Planctomycetes bacterium]|nr:efflux RND transporter periplasmic adaptor subunit [Planctomycetota bacterium]
MRHFVLCGLSASLLGLGLFAQFAASVRAAPPAKKSLATVEPAEILVTDCRVRFLNEVPLACSRSGILELTANEGDTVKAGTVVARLRDRLQQVTRTIAQREATNDIEIRFAAKASELAQAKYMRAMDANKSAAGTVSELELRELRLAAEKSLLQIEQAEHQHKIAGLKRDEAEETVSLYQVVAPFDGTVLEVYRHPGEVVREGEQILRLASVTRVRIEGYVPVDQAARLSRGQRVQARLQADDTSETTLSQVAYAGRLTFVDIKVEPVSRRVKIVAEVANPDAQLRDGLTASLSVSVNSRLETTRKD